MNIPQRTPAVITALAGLVLLAFGAWGAWLPHPTAALNILGVDLAEYVKFVPQVQSGAVRLNRLVFFTPFLALALGLILIATVMMRTLRAHDTLFRLGGDEFVFLLPNTNLAGAQQVAERLHQRIARLSIPLNGEQVRLTTSMGVATLNTHCSSLESLLQHADEALYKAKAAGRNQVTVWLPEHE